MAVQAEGQVGVLAADDALGTYGLYINFGEFKHLPSFVLLNLAPLERLIVIEVTIAADEVLKRSKQESE